MMPKAAKQKYYAVRNGRQGPWIYETWDSCKENVARYPGAIHKSFNTLDEAQRWLAAGAQSGPTVRPLGEPSTSSHPAFLPPPPPAPSTKPNSRSKSVPDPQLSFEDQPDFLPLDPAAPSIQLSPEQHKVLEMVKKGKSVFFTGSAGTGKSVLLREIIGHVSFTNNLAITASTGIASVNIGGTTLHSWAGIGLGQEDAKKLAGKFLGQPKFRKVLRRWQNVRTLIIDEISMIDGRLFDKLEYIARATRFSSDPFGGIQLVLSGDFCQLPPVPDRDGSAVAFAFEAKSWDRCVGQPVTLRKVFRQKEQRFVDMLNAMRFGELDMPTVLAFQGLTRAVHYTDSIEPTELFPMRREVDYANNSRLQKLEGAGQVYAAHDYPGWDAEGNPTLDDKVPRMLERLVAPKSIVLKVGAQVMLIKNLVQGELVNGSVGRVIAFSTPIDAANEHTEIAQVELPKGAPVPVPGAPPKQPPALPKSQSTGLWPVVLFTNGMKRLCIPTDFTVNNSKGTVEAGRSQIPLILAWALSVHKSQGQTLERVKVDLGSTFEKGQAYVALSRATSMQTLQVLNFHPDKVMAHPRVLAWHARMDREDEMDEEGAIEAYYG